MSAATVAPGADVTRSTVLVEPHWLPRFYDKLSALNRKAAAFGPSEVKVLGAVDVVYERRTETVGRDADKQVSQLVPVRDGTRCETPVLLKRIEIEYPQVRLGDWVVVGRLEAVEAGNLAFAPTRDERDARAVMAMADCPIGCEHCNTTRGRKESYVLRDAVSGQYKQVGTSCLEDFTGIDPGAALFLATMYEVVRLADSELDSFGASRRVNAVPTLEYLADVSFLVARQGFVSSTKARELGLVPTYADALELPQLLEGDLELRRLYEAERKRHQQRAEEIRQWAVGREGADTFERNLRLLLQSQALARENKHLALAAAAVPMYEHHQARLAQAARPSRHVGAVGGMLDTVLRIERIVPVQGMYRQQHMVLLRDQEGNRLKWIASNCPQDILDAEPGAAFEASLKVKAHADYQGVEQTAVTHLKVKRWLQEQEPQELVEAFESAVEADAQADVVHERPRGG